MTVTMTALQPHHRLSTCHRHPTTSPITGFCASCLRERLSTVEDCVTPTATSPGLRRTKSHSSSSSSSSSSNINLPNGASTSEPRRKSCDVRPHPNTLSNLFSLADDGESKPVIKRRNPLTNAVVVLKEEEDEEDEDGEFRTMKEFIDLELERKNGSSRFSFWESTASAFSKKLLKWKQKQQQRNNKKETEGYVADPGRATVETGSEIGLHGYFGRRSCDTDPKLSVDNGRYSFDEPRASWDGYLIGKAYPRLLAPPLAIVDEKDKEKEKESEGNEEEKSPGGSEQTRDYYGALGMQRRRRSFDKSSSGKRAGFFDVDEVNGSSINNNNKSGISNAKVSPETVGLFHGAKLLVTEKELRDSNWYSIKDYRAECVASDSKNVGYVGGEVTEKGFKFKKSLRWRNVLNKWGFMQKRNEGKCVDEERLHGGKLNAVDGLLVQKLKRVANGEANTGTVSEKLVRSYSVSARSSFQVDGSFNGVNGVEAKENGGGGKDELVLQRNRSTTYSPSNLDNGLLRFYLTPVRSYRRSKSGRSGLKNLQSVAMNGL